MLSDADVCCTKTVSNPISMAQSLSHRATGRVISYSPLPLVCTSTRCENCRRASLFNGDALGQVARLIHVAAAAHGDVIRQQLQRYDLQNRRQQVGRRRNLDDVVAEAARLRVALGYQRHHDSLTRLPFLDIRERLLDRKSTRLNSSHLGISYA